MMLTFALALASSQPAASEAVFVDEATYDSLLACWVRQWPDGVAAAENAPATEIATQDQRNSAIERTRQNCPAQIAQYTSQLQSRLQQRHGLSPEVARQRALQRLNRDLDEMFFEYWSRL